MRLKGGWARVGGRMCGKEPLLEATLVEGSPPWSLTLSTPNGNRTLSGLTNRTVLVPAPASGEYKVAQTRSPPSRLTDPPLRAPVCFC